MTHATAEYPDNLFLWLCEVANRPSREAVNRDKQRLHLELFLKWLALPRVDQVEQMVPYLHTLAGIDVNTVDLKSLRRYFDTMIPEHAPGPAKRLFLEIVEGVVMIYLHART
jgi:hypothetical protein